MKIILTGATGFVGRHILSKLNEYDLLAIGRKSTGLSGVTFYEANIDSETNYLSVLSKGDIVIHCAARAHIMSDDASDPLKAYRETNTFGTLNLAMQAAKAGVKRFIFISTIKVNGEYTNPGEQFSSGDLCSPADPYAISKHEAEIGLHEISKESGMEVVIIRSPLVYGPGVGANFLALLRLSHKRVPLPFGCINNKRSMVFVDNLVDLVVTCIDHPKAANQTLLVSDDEDISIKAVIRRLAKAFNRSAWIIPVPVFILKVMGLIFGKKDVVGRIVDSLQVDIEVTKNILTWKPPYTVDDGFKKTVTDYLLEKD
ncbi:UDP-glucose 4-epimerase family protein [Porticoccus sp. GXU_MW_L64]